MDNTQTNEIELTRVSMDDVDQFSQWEIDLGWDIESTQLSVGTNDIHFDHFAFPELIVGRFTCERSMQNRFSLPNGMLMFIICKAKQPVLWNGRYLPPTLMGIVRAKYEHWVVLPDGWDCFEFMVSEDFIRRTEIFPESFYAETTLPNHSFLPLMEPVTGQFLKGMETFFNQQKDTSNRSRTVVRNKQFMDFIIGGLMQVVDAGLAATRGLQKPRSARRPDLVKKAIDLVLGHLATDLSMDDLAQALGVSNRVLNYAFRDNLKMSPYQFILTEKLHAVRRQLKSTDLSVTEASHSYGFNSASRFTSQYQRLFGELPSATRYRDRRRGA